MTDIPEETLRAFTALLEKEVQRRHAVQVLRDRRRAASADIRKHELCQRLADAVDEWEAERYNCEIPARRKCERLMIAIRNHVRLKGARRVG